MGYSQTLPTGLFNVASGGIGSAFATLTTVNTNINLGSLVTPNYKVPLSGAYVDLHVPAREDTSGFDNSFDFSASGHLGMNDGGATFDCGSLPQSCFQTPASSFQNGDWTVRGRTNIAALIKPNTTYQCQLMHMLADGDNLILYNPIFVLNLFFGI